MSNSADPQPRPNAPVVVDEEFRTIIPPLSDAELALLKGSLLRDGVRDALTVWKTNGSYTLLDGHNRYDLCERHGLDYQLVVQPIVDRNEARLFIIDQQRGRRNLNIYQKARLAIARQDIIVAQAKERESQGGKGFQNSGNPVHTDKELGKIAGVSHDTIFKVRRLQSSVDIATKQQLESGEKTIDAVWKPFRTQELKCERDLRLQEAAAVSGDPEDHDVIAGNAELLFDRLEDHATDMFFTDPPWDAEGLEAGAYDLLGRLAAQKLKPGGWCLAYVGKGELPEILEQMLRHLTYRWMNVILHTGGTTKVSGLNVFGSYRPVVLFQQPPIAPAPHWFNDSIRGGGREKDFHRWGQGVPEAIPWLEAMTEPGHLVVDPFAGSGTIPVACCQLKRRWLATEIDEANAAVARKRIREVLKHDTRQAATDCGV